MKETEQHYIDKSSWKDGEWKSEPDRILWVDDNSKYPCLIKRNPRSGHFCGYVGIPKEHPFNGKDLQSCYFSDDIDLQVHGGITYNEECDGDDEKGVCHPSDDGDNVWWIGFDCAHGGDLSPSRREQYWEDDVYRNLEYVKNECESLASQLFGYRGDCND